jgi:hypothetical protein
MRELRQIPTGETLIRELPTGWWLVPSSDTDGAWFVVGGDLEAPQSVITVDLGDLSDGVAEALAGVMADILAAITGGGVYRAVIADEHRSAVTRRLRGPLRTTGGGSTEDTQPLPALVLKSREWC